MNTSIFIPILDIFSSPRANGSKALQDTYEKMCSWLTERNISYFSHRYTVRPYFIEIVGGVFLLYTGILTLSVFLRWEWFAFFVSVGLLALIHLEASKNIPIFSRIGSMISENLVIEFSPANPKKELVLSAHYDSKTEFFGYKVRNVLFKLMPIGFVFALLLGFLSLLNVFLNSEIVYTLNLVLSTFLLLTVGLLGINFLLGRLGSQSKGVIDNGVACAILLKMAENLSRDFSLEETKVTIVLFTGEECAAQGSIAFVEDTSFDLPTTSLNLELLGQDGPYMTWDSYGGMSFPKFSADEVLNDSIKRLVKEQTEQDFVVLNGPAGTDSVAFLANGIPSTSLGTLDVASRNKDLHRPSDNLDRVNIERLPETIQLLTKFLVQFDKI